MKNISTKLESIKNMLILVKDDTINPYGSLSPNVMYEAINGIIDYLDYIKEDIESKE